MVLATRNLLAFAGHTVCGRGEPLRQAARSKAGSRAGFFQRMATLTAYLLFPSWEALLETLAFARPPPRGP